MFEDLARTVVNLVSTYGYLVVLVFTFLEASMLFPLLPSEIVVPGAAAVLVGGPVGFALFVGAVVVGTTAGSLFAYHAFGEHGRSALHATKYVGVSEEDFERGEKWFRKWGESSVCWGRLLPFLRSVISVPAGFAGMKRWKFTLYSAVGAAAFGAIVAYAVQTGMQFFGLH